MTHLIWSTFSFVAFCALWYGGIWSFKWALEHDDYDERVSYQLIATGAVSAVAAGTVALIVSIASFGAFIWPIFFGGF